MTCNISETWYKRVNLRMMLTRYQNIAHSTLVDEHASMTENSQINNFNNWKRFINLDWWITIVKIILFYIDIFTWMQIWLPNLCINSLVLTYNQMMEASTMNFHSISHLTTRSIVYYCLKDHFQCSNCHL